MYKSAKEHQKVHTNNNVTPLHVLAKASAPEQGSCVVVDVQAHANGQLYVVDMPAYGLKVATSCLVQPLAGDRVYGVVDGQHFVITAILFRQQADAVMTLDSRCANLRIVAPEIEIEGSRRLTFRSSDFTLLTRSCRWVADTLHQVSKRLFVLTQHASRKVEQTDETQAKHILQEARGSYVMKGEIASLKASAVLKIDGGQVHVG